MSPGDLGFDVGRGSGVDQELHEGGPVWEDQVGRDGRDVFEKAGTRPLGGPCVGPELFEAVADSVDGEGQQVEGGKQRGEVLLAMAEVVSEVGMILTRLCGVLAGLGDYASAVVTSIAVS